MSNLQKKLTTIQEKLKAPKKKIPNSGVKYASRSCEEILEALKPLLLEHEVCLFLTDSIEQVGNRYYVKATATIREGDESFSSSAFAREEEIPKVMSCAQMTGSCASYARKYALGALFLIDDTKDDDTREYNQQHDTQDTAKTVAPAVQFTKTTPSTPVKTKPSKEQVVEYMKNTKTIPQLDTVYRQALSYEWTDEEKIFLMEHKEAETQRINSL